MSIDYCVMATDLPFYFVISCLPIIWGQNVKAILFFTRMTADVSLAMSQSGSDAVETF